MAGGYQNLPADPYEQLRLLIVDAKRRLDELERPTGSQYYDSLRTLTDLVNNLAEEIENVSASGATWQGPVSAGSGNIATTTGFIVTPAGYNFDITYTRHAAYLGNDGRLGWASSSIEKKELVTDVALPDPLSILAIADTYYVYKEEIAKRDDPNHPEYDPEYRVHLEYGHIAEWLHEAGLWQAVAYGPDGSPVGVHDNVLAGFALRAARFVWEKQLELEARVAALESA